MSSRRQVLHVAQEVLIGAMTLFLAVVFFMAGMAKMSDGSGWARAFAHWGYPVWFRIAIGVIEIAAAFLLLVPRMARYGALMIMATMLGGMYTHLVHDHGRHLTSEVGPLLFSTLIFLARRRDDRLHPFRSKTR
jgi:uncharacterized membrane protein YphA (DoxX/SURF4 family)